MVPDRSVGERPLKGCGFAPYIMHMIEQVTWHTFEYDKVHKALKIVVDLTEVGVTTQKSIHQKYLLQFFFLELPCSDECHV